MIKAVFPPYTLVLTSCGRFDLLRFTLQSFLSNADVQPSQILITEDSGDKQIYDVIREVAPDAKVFLHEERLGQMQSIDNLYQAVETDYVFHCEDDWEFFRTGFIAESFKLLDALPEASMICLRPRQELNPLIRNMPKETLDGLEFFKTDPTLHPEYFGYSFNPGLRRTKDFLAVAPITPLGNEADVSYAFKQRGFRIVNLEAPAVRHIGDGRHVNDPMLPSRPTTLPGRLARSIRKRWKRLQRFFERRRQQQG